MISAIIGFLVFLAVAALFVFHAASQACEGYQDGSGFHFGPDPRLRAAPLCSTCAEEQLPLRPMAHELPTAS